MRACAFGPVDSSLACTSDMTRTLASSTTDPREDTADRPSLPCRTRKPLSQHYERITVRYRYRDDSEQQVWVATNSGTPEKRTRNREPNPLAERLSLYGTHVDSDTADGRRPVDPSRFPHTKDSE